MHTCCVSLARGVDVGRRRACVSTCLSSRCSLPREAAGPVSPAAHALLCARVRAVSASRSGRDLTTAADTAAQTAVRKLMLTPDVRALIQTVNDAPVAISEIAPALNFRAQNHILNAAANERLLASPALSRELAAADVNEDGTVSRREFRKWLAANAGTVTPARETAAAASAPVTTGQLALFSLNIAVPMVGFGFVDNVTMILAGDAIDSTIGTAFGLSVLASAALGNLISDVAGIGMGDVIEAVAKKLGLPTPKFTAQQMKLASVRVVGGMSGAFGIALGCLLGMIPLLLIEDEFTKDTRRLFKALDKDDSGTLSSAELRPLMEGLGVPDPEGATKKVTHALNLDQGGTVSLNEFLHHSHGCGIQNLHKGQQR